MSVIAVLCLQVNAQSVEPFYIGDRIPDLQLERVMNYKDSNILLSALNKKLIIFDFWSTHCAGCIEAFPKQEALQKSFDGQLQFILVTFEPKEKVDKFLADFENKNNSKLSFPIVYSDSVLYYLFRHRFIPHYAWVSPDGKLFAQTDDKFINSKAIAAAISEISRRQADMEQSGFPKNMWQFPKLPAELQTLLKLNQIN